MFKRICPCCFTRWYSSDNSQKIWKCEACGADIPDNEDLIKMEEVTLRIKLVDNGCMITKGYLGDAGWDLRSREALEIKPFETGIIKTGVCVELPEGFSGDVRPRSSMNMKGVLTHYGTVDFGYTGEIKVAITNLSKEDLIINQYDRVAQLVINKIHDSNEIEIVEELPKSPRGEKGFGSTGK